MTILFMGGEMSAMVPGTGGVDEANNFYNSDFCRASVECNGTSGDPDEKFVDTAIWSAQTGDFFLHFEMAVEGSVASANNCVHLLDDSGDPVIRLRRSGGNWQLQYLDNLAVWQDAGGGDYPDAAAGSRTRFDLYCNTTSGDIVLYVQDTNRDEATGLSLGHITGIAQARFFSTIGGAFYSQVVASTTSTIGGRLATYYPSGAGASSDWTGTFAEIDERTYDDADFAFSDTNGEVSTYAMTGPAATGYVVQAVSVCARAKRGSTGPQNMQLVLRASGSDAVSSTIALDLGYYAYCAVWEQNPTTVSDWVNTQVSGLQAGFKAIT